MIVGSARGCAATTSVIITPSTGGMIGSSVFCAGSNIHTLYSGGARLHIRVGEARRRVQGTMRVGVGGVEQPALRPAHEDAAVPSHSGKPELKRPPGEGPGDRAHVVAAWPRVCAGPGQAGAREHAAACSRRTSCVSMIDEVAAEVDVGVLARRAP